MQIGLLSDTHSFLDPALSDYFSECQEIWHAGDFGSAGVLDSLESWGKVLRGVWGNVDGSDIRSRVQRDMEWMCEGTRVYMTHIGGYPGRYERRAKAEILVRKPHVFICGHSHIPRIMRDTQLGLLHVNPGACGHSGWHKERTAMRFRIEGEQVGGVELIKLGPRGQATGARGPKL